MLARLNASVVIGVLTVLGCSVSFPSARGAEKDAVPSGPQPPASDASAVGPAENGKASPDGDEGNSLNVSLDGTLFRTAEGIAVDVRGTHVFLDLHQSKTPLSSLPPLFNRTVQVRGSLRPLAGKPGKWICDAQTISFLRPVQDAVKPVGNSDVASPFTKPTNLAQRIRESGEAIVAYKPGRIDQAKAICLKEGLKIVEVYGPGHFLVCKWDKGVNVDSAVAHLQADNAIEYVEPNSRIQLDPIELAPLKRAPVVPPRPAGNPVQGPPPAGGAPPGGR